VNISSKKVREIPEIQDPRAVTASGAAVRPMAAEMREEQTVMKTGLANPEEEIPRVTVRGVTVLPMAAETAAGITEITDGEMADRDVIRTAAILIDEEMTVAIIEDAWQKQAEMYEQQTATVRGGTVLPTAAEKAAVITEITEEAMADRDVIRTAIIMTTEEMTAPAHVLLYLQQI